MENCKGCGHSAELHHDEHHCSYGQRGALLACYCHGFVSPTLEAMEGLSEGDKIKLAVLNHFGLNPKFMSVAEVTTDGGGHCDGVRVVLYFPTGRQVGEWIKNHLPKNKFPEVKFLRQDVIDFVSKRTNR